MAKIVTIETPGLGDRSYLAHDGEVAVVIDPQRDIDRVVAVADAEGVQITHVFETHIHNDYVTGGLALAEATGAAYVVAADDDVAFERVAARDGTRFDTGHLHIVAIATPGHTPNHLSYQLSADGGDPVAVFTGGSMLFGAVGRTDLIG
ncbi:MAG: MBL fold metallo-hydrolase, partial [Acidimicrobiales bacterium]